MLKKILLGFFILIIALASYVIVVVLIPGGTFKTIKPHFEGTTSAITLEIPGPEDRRRY